MPRVLAESCDGSVRDNGSDAGWREAVPRVYHEDVHPYHDRKEQKGKLLFCKEEFTTN